MDRLVGQVAEMFRYPLKSTLGERLDQVEVSWHGLMGDRVAAVRWNDTGLVVTGKLTEGLPLLQLNSTYEYEQESFSVWTPEGESYYAGSIELPKMLGARLGRPVNVVWARRHGGARSYETTSKFSMHPGVLVDSSPVHLLSTASLATLARLSGSADAANYRRFRPNFLIRSAEGDEGFVEDEWVGARLRIGESFQGLVREATSRCALTTRQQRSVGANPGALQALRKFNGSHLGVYLAVINPGIVRTNDAVWLEY